MAHVEVKTKPTGDSVEEYLAGRCGEDRQSDCAALLDLMGRVTGEKPVLWGSSIVGFGTYRYRYASGREGDWFLVGFTPRKSDLSIYIMAGFEKYEDLLSRLGKYKTGRSCLYIKRLSDVDMSVLEEIITDSVEHMRTSS